MPSGCLKWPLERGVRLSSKLLEVEQYWRNHTGNVSKNLPPKVKKGFSKYVLAMFPYPSGRLHIGHLRVYTISDVCTRYYTLNGFHTIHPIGWDAFGLPAENAARQHDVDPKVWTYENIEVMREQLKATGIEFDWDREIFTCKSDYYKWTQWIFLQLHRHGLVRRTLAEVFWDPVDQTVLAAEQVDFEGKSWRSGAPAELRRLRHWAIETPKYAKRLLDGLEALRFDWGEVANIQANWIGKCDVFRFLLPTLDFQGNEIPDEKLDLRVYDPADLQTARFILLTSDHSLAIEHRRLNFDKFANHDFYLLDKKVFNFLNGVQMPIVVVPNAFATTDKRNEVGGRFFMDAKLADPFRNDFDAKLAKRFALHNAKISETNLHAENILQYAESKGFGGYLTSRTLRDWVVSRQRAWGTPIPMILDNELSFPVSEQQLPISLEQRGQPIKDDRFLSASGVLETDTLDTFFDSSWYYLRYLDPKNAEFLADRDILHSQMPVDVYVGGIEHADIHLFFSRFVSHFLHDTLGLLPGPEPFRRLIPQGIVRGRTFRIGNRYILPENVMEKPKGSGRYVEISSGEIVSHQFEKMSKSKHNGVDPLALLESDGVDLTRLQLLNAAAPRQPINWGATQISDVKGLKRFLDRCSAVISMYIEGRRHHNLNVNQAIAMDEAVEKYCKDLRNECIRTVSVAVEVINVHNTAIKCLQIFASALKKIDAKTVIASVEFEKAVHALVIMLQIFSPFTAAELWSALGSAKKISPFLWKNDAPVSAQKWPPIDTDAIIDFVISVGNKKLSCRECRDVIEPLNTKELLELARTKYFANFFNTLCKRDVRVTKAELQTYPGLQMMLNLKLGNASPKDIIEVFDQFVKKKRQLS